MNVKKICFVWGILIDVKIGFIFGNKPYRQSVTASFDGEREREREERGIVRERLQVLLWYQNFGK